MFSNWFSGHAREQDRASSYKQRMDQVGNSLVELHYADEVLRQHLHEWLRFPGVPRMNAFCRWRPSTPTPSAHIV